MEFFDRGSPLIRLTVKDYSLWCHLGCSAAEREQKQEVRVSLQIDFAEPPRACLSDKLIDTVCYAQACKKLSEFVSRSTFHTVEHMGYQMHTAVQELFQSAQKVNLILHKVKPPIDNLHGGVTFEIESAR